jgi:hypothetical protein
MTTDHYLALEERRNDNFIIRIVASSFRIDAILQ